ARGNEERLNFTLSASHVGAWDWNAMESAVLSAKSREIFGLGGVTGPIDREQFYSMIVPEDRDLVRATADGARAGAGTYEIEYRIVRADGELRWISSKGTMMRDESGRPTRMVGVHADITERKSMEQTLREEVALRESEARLREIADAMPQIVFTAKADGRIDYFNRKWYELTLTSRGPITDETWLSQMHPDDRDNCIMSWRANVNDGKPHENEGRFRCASTGQYHWHLTRALPVRDETGTIVRWYGTATDIDFHKQAEEALRGNERQLRLLGEQLELRVAARTAELQRSNEALRSSEERFSKAFRASPDAIVIARQPEGRIIEINERWEAMFRFTRAEAIGRTFDSLKIYANAADQEKFRELMSLQGYVRELELDVRNSKSEILRAVIAAETVDVGGEPCVIVMMRDITERRRAEHEIVAQRRQLAHLGRVAVLGELSAALAHELNQPLTAILANARAAQRMLTRERVDRAELRAILDDVAADDLRAGAVIHRVRALLRKGDAEPQPVVANEVVTEVLELAHSDLIQRGVSVVTRLAPTLPATPADRVQLQQVVLNLIVNAAEAMTDNPLSDRTMVVTTALEGAAVRLSVTDRGPGITGSVDAVFEPFITSKEHGLGLGLSICRSIVNAHGGRMWAVNNKDRGATFHVLLPLSSAGALKESTPLSIAAIPDRR
ncbi:MAG: PAS domain S-box protein, partial [bacterium]